MAILKIADKDNVGIVTDPDGLKKGTKTDGIILLEDISMGFKVALENIQPGKEIIRYGEVIGLANEQIEKGSLVHTSKMILPEPPPLQDIPIQDNHFSSPEPLEGYFFEGYKLFCG